MVAEQHEQPIAVYLEVGAKRTIAGALSWPGWYRVARDEAGALQTLVEYTPRYERLVLANIVRVAQHREIGLAVLA
jgi:hypothetical protein